MKSGHTINKIICGWPAYLSLAGLALWALACLSLLFGNPGDLAFYGYWLLLAGMIGLAVRHIRAPP